MNYHCDLFSNVAEAIINSQKWKLALSNHITMENGSETTPLRKLIQRMPGKAMQFVILYNIVNHHECTIDVAELVLKKCTVTKAKDRSIQLQPDSKDYTVTFNYEFIEDKDVAKTCVSHNSLMHNLNP